MVGRVFRWWRMGGYCFLVVVGVLVGGFIDEGDVGIVCVVWWFSWLGGVWGVVLCGLWGFGGFWYYFVGS